MNVAEKHIRHYNRLNGAIISKEKLRDFHIAVKKDIDSKKIDAHMPLGFECTVIEKKIASAIRQMNGDKHVKLSVKQIDVNKILALQSRLAVKTVVPAKKPKPAPPERKVIIPEKKIVAPEKKKPVAKPSKAVVERKSPAPQKETPARHQVAPKVSQAFDGLGFITADMTPAAPKDTFTLSGPIGSILGRLQRFKLEIVIPGETHSGKSELGKQIADPFISAGFSVGWVDWEQGGLESRDTQESINRNLKPENKKKLQVSAKVPKTLEAVKSLANKFDVVVLDSGTSLKMVTNEWIDQLREEHPKTIWIILMQQNTKGGTRGGSAAEYDSPVVLFTYRPDHRDYLKNYAKIFKNRGNPDVVGKYYLIAQKKMVNEDPTTSKPETEQPKEEVGPQLLPLK